MQTDALRQLWKLAFGDSEDFIQRFLDTAYSPERCCSICVDGRLAAALYWLDGEFRGQKLAYIYAVATHPEYRGRGLCRKLMMLTHDTLAAQGYAGALLMPAVSGLRNMYKKMGYRECCTISQFTCNAGTPVPIWEVNAEEFIRLRRKYLPADGVLQEGCNIRYLQSYARVYAGEDFLLTAISEEQQLIGLELLGNPHAAPGILGALGYPQGTFRTPGRELPFAMFHPLREDAAAPGYLGLAFD